MKRLWILVSPSRETVTLMVGNKLLETHSRYRLLSANCQTFVILLLKALCGKEDDDHGIEETFERERLGGGRTRKLSSVMSQ